MKEIRYARESLLRDPVEYWSAAAMAIGALILLAAPEMLLMPTALAQAGAAVIGYRGFYRYRQGRRLAIYQKQLTSLASYTRSSGSIGYSRKNLWLGLGFEWDERHTQRVFDLDQQAGRAFRSLPRVYKLARALESALEHQRLAQPLVRFLGSQHRFNPAKPLPDGGGRPELHAVGMWEGEKEVNIPLPDRVGHTLVLGTTRVGKTRLAEVLIGQDIRRGDVVIVFDPKGDADLLLRMYAECKAAGRLDDFHVFNLGTPDLSEGYNPIGSFMRVTEVATRIAGQMPGEGQSATFRQFVWGYVNTVAAALLAMGIVPDYNQIKRYSSNIEPLFLQYMEWLFQRSADQGWRHSIDKDIGQLAKKKEERSAEFNRFSIGRDLFNRSHQAIAFYKYYMEHPALHDNTGRNLCEKINYDASHMSKLIASLAPFLDKMTTGKIAEILVPDGSRRQFDWNDIIQAGGVVYVGLDALSDSEVAAAVGNSMFSDLTSIAGRIYKTGHDFGLPEELKGHRERVKKDIKISLHADEFNELIGQEFIPMLNKAGGAGVQVTAYTQTLPDIAARLGNADKAGQVIGNFNTLIMLRVLDESTAKLMTLRQKEVYVVTTDLISGASESTDPMGGLGSFSSNTTERQTRQKVQMITVSNLLSLPKGQAFALINGNRLFKVRMPLPDKNDFAGIPHDLMQITDSMSKNYRSALPHEYRFNEYLDLKSMQQSLLALNSHHGQQAEDDHHAGAGIAGIQGTDHLHHADLYDADNLSLESVVGLDEGTHYG